MMTVVKGCQGDSLTLLDLTGWAASMRENATATSHFAWRWASPWPEMWECKPTPRDLRFLNALRALWLGDATLSEARTLWKRRERG